MDIVVLAIFALTIFVCMRRGFIYSIVSLLRGIASFVIAYFFCDDLAAFLKANTEIDEIISSKIQSVVQTRWESSDIYLHLPEILKSGSGNLGNSIASGTGEKIANVIILALCFIVIVVAIRLVLKLVLHTFSKKYNEGFRTRLDWTLGLIFGILLGLINVFLILALIIPITGFIAPSLAGNITNWMEGSVIAQDLYDNNIVLLLISNYFK